MRLDFLAKPVSDEAPAGPDLDEEGDGDYLNYVLVASDRLPTSFLVQVPGAAERKPFDRSSIELDKETEKIAALLERTRDIRLLTLDARFNAAAGNIIGFSEATQGLATVVSSFWDDVHPKAPDGDMIVRQNTVESLDDLGQIVLHLQNAVIAGGGRTRPVSLRHHLIATGKAEKREDEEPVPLDQISSTMTNEANAAQVTEVHAAIEASQAALETVRTTFLEKAGAEFSLNFDRLYDTYKMMKAMIGSFRADLAPPVEASESTDGYADSAGSAAITGMVKTHADAAAALAAAESYFLRLEPSSPALILVHQSRMLIGRPLVFALEALMPEPSARAALRFDSGFRFDIDLTRMKYVTDDALSLGVPEDPDAGAPEADAEGGWSTGTEESSAESSSDDGWAGWSSSSEETPAESSGETSETPSEGAESPDGSGSGDGSEESHVSESSPEPEAEPAPPPPPPRPPPPSGPVVFAAKTRGQASDLIQATEAFFRTAEPSSAIPVLLSKARSYISKDFASILSELIPRDPSANE